jgi:hypothetical protein
VAAVAKDGVGAPVRQSAPYAKHAAWVQAVAEWHRGYGDAVPRSDLGDPAFTRAKQARLHPTRGKAARLLEELQFLTT